MRLCKVWAAQTFDASHARNLESGGARAGRRAETHEHPFAVRWPLPACGRVLANASAMHAVPVLAI